MPEALSAALLCPALADGGGSAWLADRPRRITIVRSDPAQPKRPARSPKVRPAPHADLKYRNNSRIAGKKPETNDFGCQQHTRRVTKMTIEKDRGGHGPAPSVAIIGLGHVGRQVSERLRGAVSLLKHDPAVGEYASPEDLAQCAIGVVCVGTPPAPDGSCDISSVEQAVRDAPMKTLWLRSTVPPGTTDKLSKKYDKLICYSPEYIGETHYSDSYRLEDFLVVGGESEARHAIISLVLRQSAPPTRLFQCTSVEAELIKYMENCYLALKVGFVNEFYELATSVGADWNQVREGWLLDPRIGPSHTIVFPHRRGFEGRCLPKDLDALVALAHERGVPMTILEALGHANLRYRESVTSTAPIKGSAAYSKQHSLLHQKYHTV